MPPVGFPAGGFLQEDAYGNGLRLVLQNLSKHIRVFETPEAARKTSIKDKQPQIIRSSEHILELLNNEKL